MEIIYANEAHVRKGDGWLQIDVRDTKGFSKIHVPNSVNIPVTVKEACSYSKGAAFVNEVSRRYRKDDKIIVTCADGDLSSAAALRLIAVGFQYVSVVYCGINEWSRYRNLPLTRNLEES